MTLRHYIFYVKRQHCSVKNNEVKVQVIAHKLSLLQVKVYRLLFALWVINISFHVIMLQRRTL